MSDASFEVYYGNATNYDKDFLHKCSQEPCVLTKVEDKTCHIYLIVTEKEIRQGRTTIPCFLDTRKDSRMTLLTNPSDPSAPWKRVYWLPKKLTEDIINYLDAEKDKVVF